MLLIIFPLLGYKAIIKEKKTIRSFYIFTAILYLGFEVFIIFIITGNISNGLNEIADTSAIYLLFLSYSYFTILKSHGVEVDLQTYFHYPILIGATVFATMITIFYQSIIINILIICDFIMIVLVWRKMLKYRKEILNEKHSSKSSKIVWQSYIITLVNPVILIFLYISLFAYSNAIFEILIVIIAAQQILYGSLLWRKKINV